MCSLFVENSSTTSLSAKFSIMPFLYFLNFSCNINVNSLPYLLNKFLKDVLFKIALNTGVNSSKGDFLYGI